MSSNCRDISSPHDPDLTITKRIVALEGDTVRPLPQSEKKSGTSGTKICVRMLQPD
jgi:hypothetical protein